MITTISKTTNDLASEDFSFYQLEKIIVDEEEIKNVSISVIEDEIQDLHLGFETVYRHSDLTLKGQAIYSHQYSDSTISIPFSIKPGKDFYICREDCEVELIDDLEINSNFDWQKDVIHFLKTHIKNKVIPHDGNLKNLNKYCLCPDYSTGIEFCGRLLGQHKDAVEICKGEVLLHREMAIYDTGKQIVCHFVTYKNQQQQRLNGTHFVSFKFFDSIKDAVECLGQKDFVIKLLKNIEEHGRSAERK